MNWAGSKDAGNSPPFAYTDPDTDWRGSPVNTALRWGSFTYPYNEDGSYSVHPRSSAGNPLANAVEPIISNNKNMNTLNAFLEFRIIEGLTFKVTGGAIISDVNNRSYFNRKTKQGLANNGYGKRTARTVERYQNSNILAYDKSFGQHHLTLTGVAEQLLERGDEASLLAYNFIVDQTKISDLGAAKQIVNSSNVYERALNSYLGRINYSFNNKYLFSASYRADGSSVFGANNKWGYFPSVSAAWRLSEEDFIRDLNIFSDLKLRGSWGVTGNQGINPYQTFSAMASGSNYPYNGTSETDIGFSVASAPNPNLKWESTTQSDVGIEFALFNGRLTFSADYYVKTTKDLLLLRKLPTLTGFENIIDNGGSVENKGLEFAIGGDILEGPVKWNSGFNISGNRNKVLDIGDNPFLNYNTTLGGYGVGRIMYLKKGEPFGQMYGFGYEGVWSTKDASKAAAFGQLPGDPKYTDNNNDGMINSQDLKVIGNAIPKYVFGWTNQVSYKNFDLTFLIQGVQGNDVFNMTRIRLESPAEGVSTRLLDRWTPDNQDTDIPAFIDQVTRQNANLVSKVSLPSEQPNQTSHYVEDGSYVRLKNINIAYSLPKSLISKLRLSKARIYVSGMNLVTLTKYSGFDPEVSSFNANDARIGIDFSNYPTSKTYSVGLDISF